MTLVDIALVLENFAAGRTSDRAGLQAGALALNTLANSGPPIGT